MKLSRLLEMNLTLALGLTVLSVSAEAAAPERMISASGLCTHSVVPDRGSINIVAMSQDLDLQKASRKTTDAYEKLKSAVQKLNLKDLELSTSEYDLSEINEWQKDRSVFKGFRARMGLSVTTSEISKLGEVIAVAANEGLHEVSGLRTFLSDAKTESEKESCLEHAVENARAKASRMAKAANGRLGKVISVVETGSSLPQPPVQRMAMGMAMDKAEMASTANVDAGTQKIGVSVDVAFTLE
jgi:uncharacterized protein YggE